MPDESATLLDFAAVNDAAAATTKKLIKQQRLGEYFKSLGAEDLKLAIRYAGGRAFPSTSERVLGVSGSIVSDVVLSMLTIDPVSFRALVIKSGEIGEALATIWATRANQNPAASPRDASSEPLRLHDLAHAFDALSTTGSQQQKKQVVRALFDRAAHPREAAYLAKIIFSDLRTGVREGVLQAAVAQAFEKPLAEIQRTQLLVGDLDEVALLAKRDALSAARFNLFHPIQFMLATPEETADDAAKTMDGRPFYSEDKLDGIRAQIHKMGEGSAARIFIYTRTMDRTDESFPDVVAQIRALPGDFLLDGEIVPYRDGKVLPFAHIQKRLGRKVVAPKILRENPAVFIAFDILYRDGELLMERPLRDRREALHRMASPAQEVRDRELATPSPLGEGQGEGPSPAREVRDGELPTPSPSTLGEGRGEGRGPAREVRDGELATPSPSTLGEGRGEGLAPAHDQDAPHESAPSPHPTLSRRTKRGLDAPLLITAITEVRTAGDIDRTFCSARDCGNEGLVLKDPDSIYSPGRRGKVWLKIKTHLPTIDCVVTAAEYGHGKRRNSLSDYTFAVWDIDPTTNEDAKLVNIGKAFSGVTDAEIAQLTELFLKIAIANNGRVFQVEPKLVLEIACDQIQPSDRHASGFALRFPRIKRVRWDKNPIDAERLSRIVQIYQSSSNTARREPNVEAAKSIEPSLFDHLEG